MKPMLPKSETPEITTTAAHRDDSENPNAAVLDIVEARIHGYHRQEEEAAAIAAVEDTAILDIVAARIDGYRREEEAAAMEDPDEEEKARAGAHLVAPRPARAVTAAFKEATKEARTDPLTMPRLSRTAEATARADLLERPGAYVVDAPGVVPRRLSNMDMALLGASSSHPDWGPALADDSSSSSFTSEDVDVASASDPPETLVEARPVSDEISRVPGHAHPVPRPNNKRQWAWRCWGLMGLMAIAAVVVVAVVVSISMGKSSESTISSSYNHQNPDLLGEGGLVPTSTSETLINDLPDYTLLSLQDPLSPQSEAYHWLSQHRNLTNLPQWRRRQLFALATFYYGSDGPNWPFGLDEDWLDDSRSECSWYTSLYGYFSRQDGVSYLQHDQAAQNFTCNEKGEFHTLRINNAAKVGFSVLDPYIPPEISLLTALKYFGMADNGLANLSTSEFFPPQFYQLTNLEYLTLRDNPLRVPNSPLPLVFPSELGLLTKLTKLYLYNCSFNGPLPSELGLLTNLEILDVFENELTGTMPTQIGLMTSLKRLRVRDNQLHGSIPSELGLLTNAFGMLFSRNPRMTGTIPSSIGAGGTLGYFGITGNPLITGEIPEPLCRLESDSCSYVWSNKEKACYLKVDCSDQVCGCSCGECSPKTEGRNQHY